jgi:hypothetical protein
MCVRESCDHHRLDVRRLGDVRRVGWGQVQPGAVHHVATQLTMIRSGSRRPLLLCFCIEMVFFLCVVVWLPAIVCTARDGSEGAASRTRSMKVHYPYHFFSPESTSWRSKKATFNKIFTESPGDYGKLSSAQDHEDIWLYENWFYGMENGVILESGALDGVFYSTSNFFETLLHWTSIHIGVTLSLSFSVNLTVSVSLSLRTHLSPKRLIQEVIIGLFRIVKMRSISTPLSVVKVNSCTIPMAMRELSKALLSSCLLISFALGIQRSFTMKSN